MLREEEDRESEREGGREREEEKEGERIMALSKTHSISLTVLTLLTVLSQ